MKQLLLKLWRDEAGAETAEWLVIVAVLVVIALAVYNTELQTGLTALVAEITTLLGTIIV
ncbi:MAG: Flp family type IVb pilin [Candidatus Thiodiazotropha sp. (ex Dulcina madagascariensis)]|nr:Flp family type IVb pilin [Candidatus Thiodiazotropha sp. (ex Dulcina madagascariensis)]